LEDTIVLLLLLILESLLDPFAANAELLIKEQDLKHKGFLSNSDLFSDKEVFDSSPNSRLPSSKLDDEGGGRGVVEVENIPPDFVFDILFEIVNPFPSTLSKYLLKNISQTGKNKI